MCGNIRLDAQPAFEAQISAPAPTIAIDRLARRFGNRWALAGVSLEIPSGTAWMLTGPNGSGKSTLLRCVATALKPHHGTIRMDGRDLWVERSALRRELGFLGHYLHVWDDLSPRDNLIAWARLGGLSADPDALLRRVGLDPARPDPVRTMSAGMKRRLAFARLLLKKPRLALLDEPFGALDPQGRELVIDVLKELRDSGATLMLATHLPAFASRACSHALVLEDGKLIRSCTAAELVGAPS